MTFFFYEDGKPVIILTGGQGASYLHLEEIAINPGETHRSIFLEQDVTFVIKGY